MLSPVAVPRSCLGCYVDSPCRSHHKTQAGVHSSTLGGWTGRSLLKLHSSDSTESEERIMVRPRSNQDAVQQDAVPA